MIACDRPLVYRWHSNRLTCANLGLYINAAVLSAGAGKSGDKNRAILRSIFNIKKNIYIYIRQHSLAWFAVFVTAFFPFSMTRFYQLLQKSPRATFCHKKWRGLKFPQSGLSAVPDCVTGLRLFASETNKLKFYNQWFENFRTEFRSLKWLCPHDHNFISKCRQSSPQNSYFFTFFRWAGASHTMLRCVSVRERHVSVLCLSPPGRGPLLSYGEEKKKAHGGRREGGREIPLPIVPCALVFCRLLLFSLGYPAEPLRRREVFVSLPFTLYQTAFFGTKINHYW